MAGLSLLEPLQVVGNAARSQPHTAPSFAHGLSSAQVFLWAQSLPPLLVWAHCPSDWLPILWFATLSPLSLMLLIHCSSLALSLWVPHLGCIFSPHPLWPGLSGLGLENLLFPALAPWTPRKVQARILIPTDGRAAKNEEESKAAQHPGVAHVPHQGRVGLGGALKSLWS